MKLQKKTLSMMAILALSLGALAAQAAELVADPAHSNIGFAVKHLKVSTVNGNFGDFSGTVNLDEKDITKSKIDFVVKVESINTSNLKRDDHLRSADFFDVKKFPEARFTSSSIKAKGKDQYQLEGNLSLHGVTKKISLSVTSLGKVKDPWGVEKTLFQAEGQISRKDFGIVYNAPLESGGVLISDEVALKIDLQLAPKAPAAAK